MCNKAQTSPYVNKAHEETLEEFRRHVEVCNSLCLENDRLETENKYLREELEALEAVLEAVHVAISRTRKEAVQ